MDRTREDTRMWGFDLTWWWRKRDPEWGTAPVSSAVPEVAPLDPDPIVVQRRASRRKVTLVPAQPHFEDFVLLRRRLPLDPTRALEVARRAAVADPEVRRRVLRAEAEDLALDEAVELAVMLRLAEGRALRR